MKNLRLLFLAILVVFTSCSSDDDNTINLTADITGTWNLTEFEFEGGSEITFEGQTIALTFTGIGKDFDAQVTFASNPNTYVSSGPYTLVYTVEFMGITDSDEAEIDLEDELGSGQWSIQGNQIILENNNGEDRNAQIIHLTQNKMVLIEEVEMDIDGFIVTVNSEMVLER